jgi:hypothetical protein
LVKLTTALFLGSRVLRVWPQTRYPSHWMGSGAKLVAFKHDSRHVEFTTLLGSAQYNRYCVARQFNRNNRVLAPQHQLLIFLAFLLQRR